MEYDPGLGFRARLLASGTAGGQSSGSRPMAARRSRRRRRVSAESLGSLAGDGLSPSAGDGSGKAREQNRRINAF